MNEPNHESPPVPSADSRKNVNPEMLVLARESRDISQADLAASIGISQGKVSKYESGVLDVSDTDLARISKALEYPADFFYLADTVYGFGSSCYHHRKRQSLPVRELRVIHARINVIRLHLARLLSSVDVRTLNSFNRLDIDEYDGSPEMIARLTRASWGLPMGPVRNIVSAIENAGGIVIQCSFGTPKIDAVSQWPRQMPPLLFINKEIPVDRWRFSLAHELGHLIMHRIPTPDCEREADRFASEFLMPEREIKSDLEGLTLQKAASLKPYWRVAMQALMKRAHELEQITPERYKYLYIQISKLGYRKNEPAQLAPEEPTVIRDLLKVYFGHYKYEVPQLSKLVRSNEDDFRRLFLGEEPPRLRVVR